MKYFVLLSVLWPSVGFSQWQSLMAAKNVDELLVAERDLHEKTERRLGCYLELNNQLFPENCIQEIEEHLEVPGNEKSLGLFFNRVNKLCIKNRQEVRTLQKIEQILAVVFVPAGCRLKLEERRRDLLYIKSQEIGPDLEIVFIHGKD